MYGRGQHLHLDVKREQVDVREAGGGREVAERSARHVDRPPRAPMFPKLLGRPLRGRVARSDVSSDAECQAASEAGVAHGAARNDVGRPVGGELGAERRRRLDEQAAPPEGDRCSIRVLLYLEPSRAPSSR